MRRLWLLSVILEDAAKALELLALQTLISFSRNSLPAADVLSLEKCALIRRILLSEEIRANIESDAGGERGLAQVFAFAGQPFRSLPASCWRWRLFCSGKSA